MVILAVVATIAATTVTAANIASSVHRLLEVADSVDVVVEFKDGNTRALRSAKLELNSIQERGPRIAHLRSLLVKTMESSQKEALEDEEAAVQPRRGRPVSKYGPKKKPKQYYSGP
ncbi:hypothetical protein H310_14441 [Aphanomyces invadans]|uniref:RxLR effector protein n=1 Tax=Aphanomyces invadans TaxID=157072 RepID=A0A024T9N5_9STRA|nr:hypothetical protein H310_14441 [Aphanomyces invadans]ETV90845.1 hypothetical protein H310_14441 [Aphanomyces invadans]|eukprot:XP_008880523.1 hypothetical protein H310_14441 [Aphanomyces invadans]